MPSFLHEALIKMLRDEPGVVPVLLRDVMHVPLPEYTTVRVESADLSEIRPTEYRADLVVLLAEGRPVLAVIVEVQLRKDAAKRRSWPVYVATVHARFECPACVLVITPRRSVARWAREPVDLGPGSRFEPIVLGPEGVPIIVDPAAAERSPELAVLSAMAHGRRRNTAQAVRIAFAALAGSVRLDEETAAFYADVVRVSLGKAARAALEVLMQSRQHWEFRSDFAKKYTAIGEAKGEARALLRVIERRGITIAAEQRERVLACTDLKQLERWLDHAATAASAEEIFG